jgi:hypothetical protein
LRKAQYIMQSRAGLGNSAGAFKAFAGFMLCAVLCVSFNASAKTTIQLSLWAAQATKENIPKPHFDAPLNPIKKAVADLPFNSYRTVKTVKKTISDGPPTKIALNKKYALLVKVLAKEKDGRIRLELAIELPPKKKGGKPVRALTTRVLMKPKEMIKLRGLKLDKGEMVVVLQAK